MFSQEAIMIVNQISVPPTPFPVTDHAQVVQPLKRPSFHQEHAEM